MTKPVFVLGGARTPFAEWARGIRGDGTPGGALKSLDVFDLGAAALKGALEKTSVAPDRVQAIVFGFAFQTHPNSCYGSRYIGLRAGLPESVPCLAVNLTCGTGLSAAVSASRLIIDGEASVAAAGGCESLSHLRKEILFTSFNDLSAGSLVSETVDEMARAWGLTREQSDAWALQSHERALKARAAGVFAEEIVPAGGASEDDHILAKPSLDHFSKEQPLHGGVVTKFTVHGLADGGAALILADENGAKASKDQPLGRIVSWSFAGVSPRRMAYASVPVIKDAVQKAGWKLSDVDLFEVNETFAAQVLGVKKELALDPERLNVNGGALALGHPFGATGARLILTLLRELRRRRRKKGVAAICIGGGQGVAVAVEAS